MKKIIMAVAGLLLLFNPSFAAEESFPNERGGSYNYGTSSIDVPTILSDADAERYMEIFVLQDEGKMNEAAKLSKQVNDKRLMGYVLAERYLHPTAYRSSFAELKSWMDEYHDHPIADRIYKLAMKKRAKDSAAPKKPTTGQYLSGTGNDDGFYDNPNMITKKSRTAKQEKRREEIMSIIHKKIRQGGPTAGKNYLEADGEMKNLLSQSEYDKILAWIATSYYMEGVDKKALAAAQQALEKSGDVLPQANWIAGLSLWRMGDREESLPYFEKAATSKAAGPWMKSAGYFWAARAAREGDGSNMRSYLKKAAQYTHSFYGMAAHEALGTSPDFNWRLDRPESKIFADIRRYKGGERALALIQAGRVHNAEREFRLLFAQLPLQDAPAIMFIARQTGMSSLSMRIARHIKSRQGISYDAALYPLPIWEPEGGYQVDRALLFALMRQESGFNPMARSSAGARGLMQIMPATAKTISKIRHRDQLFKPQYNIDLAQRYVNKLMQSSQVDRNLFFFTAAYNAGPGNLARWQKKVEYGDDPLLFIESMPVKETRDFTERVLTNYWIYRKQFNQSTPSLDKIVNKAWPIYHAREASSYNVAANQ